MEEQIKTTDQTEKKDDRHDIFGPITPGEWTESLKFLPKANEAIYAVMTFPKDGKKLVAICPRFADARLIAEAPELKKKVKEMEEKDSALYNFLELVIGTDAQSTDNLLQRSENLSDLAKEAKIWLSELFPNGTPRC